MTTTGFAFSTGTSIYFRASRPAIDLRVGWLPLRAGGIYYSTDSVCAALLDRNKSCAMSRALEGLRRNQIRDRCELQMTHRVRRIKQHIGPPPRRL